MESPERVEEVQTLACESSAQLEKGNYVTRDAPSILNHFPNTPRNFDSSTPIAKLVQHHFPELTQTVNMATTLTLKNRCTSHTTPPSPNCPRAPLTNP